MQTENLGIHRFLNPFDFVCWVKEKKIAFLISKSLFVLKARSLFSIYFRQQAGPAARSSSVDDLTIPIAIFFPQIHTSVKMHPLKL